MCIRDSASALRRLHRHGRGPSGRAPAGPGRTPDGRAGHGTRWHAGRGSDRHRVGGRGALSDGGTARRRTILGVVGPDRSIEDPRPSTLAWRPPMKLFLDTADIDEIRTAVRWGVIDGVTTNPSLYARAGRRRRSRPRAHRG